MTNAERVQANNAELREAIETAKELPDAGNDATDAVLIVHSTTGGEGVLGDRSTYKSVTIPNGVKTLGNYAFSGCTSLTSVTIPDSALTVNVQAFYNCTSLKSVTFKGTPNSINSTAFKSCSKLYTINVPWAEGAVANAPWGATNATINYNYTGE